MEALRSVSRLFWGPSPTPSGRPSPTPARPFWVRPVGGGEGGEGRPRGVLAASLGELRQQAGRALGLPLPPSLALAEDGTLLEDEGFFGSLPPHTELQALGPGQRWEPPRGAPDWDLGGAPPRPSPTPELWLRWHLGPEGLLREVLRVLTALTRALGQALLGLSGALRPLLEGPQSQPGER